MKILYVVKNMRLDSGVNTSVATIANHLTQEGHEIHLASLAGPGPLIDRLRLPPDRLISLAPGTSRLATIAKLRRTITRHRFDIVHTHLYDAGVVGRIATLGTKTATVATEHSTFFPHLKWHHTVLDALLARYRTDCLVAVSRSVAATFASRTGILPTSIHVIHNGVHTNGLTPTVFPKASSGDGGVNILLAGRLEVEKNIDLAIDIVQRLHGEGRKVTLNVAGRGALLPALERRCNERMMDGSVRFLGVVSDMAVLMKSMHLLLLPSHWEGCPMTVLEAYAAGLPVVATAVPGIIDIVDDSVTGLLINPDDAASGAKRIGELLMDDLLRDQLVGNALIKVRQFDAAVVAEKHLECYRGVLKQRLAK